MRAPAEQVIVDVDSNFQWPFEVKTIIVDNLTDHYAYSPDAQRFIQPNIAGLVLPIHPTQTPKLLWKAPPGKTQPALASNAQELTIVFVDSLFPPTSGSTVVAAVTSTWPDGTAALPGFANQNDLSLGLFRKAANQLGFSVAGVEQFELGQNYARFTDGVVGAPSLSFLTEPTMGIFRSSAGVLAFVVGGTERVRVTSQFLRLLSGTRPVPDVDATIDIGTSVFRFQDYFASDAFVVGTSPASVGNLRLPASTVWIAWRNVGNTGDRFYGDTVADSYIRLGAQTANTSMALAIAGAGNGDLGTGYGNASLIFQAQSFQRGGLTVRTATPNQTELLGASGGAGIQGFAVDDNATAGETRGLIWDITAAAYRRISIGAAGSGGVGFRLLRIPN